MDSHGVPRSPFFFPPPRLCHRRAGESCRGLPEVVGGSCRLRPLRIPTRNTHVPPSCSCPLLSPPSSGSPSRLVYLSCPFPGIKVNDARPTSLPRARFPLEMTGFPPSQVPPARNRGPRPALFLEGVPRQSGPSRVSQSDLRSKWRGL